MLADKPLVARPDNIRLAMLGMVDGNGHPYSWSAIINGRYDAAGDGRLRLPGHSAIPGRRADGEPGHPAARRSPTSGATIRPMPPKVARAVAHPPRCRTAGRRDRPGRRRDHRRPIAVGSMSTAAGRSSRPGCPCSSTNRCATREEHLRQFVAWQAAGKPFLSDQLHALRAGSSLRCAERLARGRRASADHHDHGQELGAVRHPRPGGRVSAARRPADG